MKKQINQKVPHLSTRFLFISLSLLIPSMIFGNTLLENDEIKIEERRLREIRQELEKTRKKEKDLSHKEVGILKQLKVLEEALDLSGKRIQRFRDEETKATQDLENLNQHIQETEINLSRNREILLKRIRSYYLRGRIHPLELLLSSRSFFEGTQRIKYWNLISKQDRKIYHETQRLKIKLEEEKINQEKTLKNLQEIHKEVEKEEEQQKKEKEERRKILVLTQDKKKEYTEAAQELEKVAKDLENLIEELEKKRKKKPEIFPPGFHPFEAKKGNLLWPVTGKVISTFGLKKHPKYKTATVNNGIDVASPIGEPVVSIGHGRVVFSDRYLGYGKIILIDHGGGYYSLYGHLSDYTVLLNDSVEEGERIGWVGDSGSLEGSKLHFEFRKNGRPEDPLKWLKKR